MRLHNSSGPLVWSLDSQEAFEQLKLATVSFPDLAILHFVKPFHFFCPENTGAASRISTLKLGLD